MRVSANCYQLGDEWIIEVPECPGTVTSAKTFKEVPEAVANAVAPVLDVDPRTVEVTTRKIPRPGLNWLPTA